MEYVRCRYCRRIFTGDYDKSKHVRAEICTRCLKSLKDMPVRPPKAEANRRIEILNKLKDALPHPETNDEVNYRIKVIKLIERIEKELLPPV